MKGFIALLLVIITALLAVIALELVKDDLQEPPPSYEEKENLKRRSTEIKISLQMIWSCAHIYRDRTGNWPDSIDEMGKDLDENNELAFRFLKDPWGNEYEYEIRDGTTVVICLGRDANIGGDGDDQDYEYPESEDN